MGLLGRYDVRVFYADSVTVAAKDGAANEEGFERNKAVLEEILGKDGFEEVKTAAVGRSVAFGRKVAVVLATSAGKCTGVTTAEADWSADDWANAAVDVAASLIEASGLKAGSKILYFERKSVSDPAASIYYGEDVFSDYSEEDIILADEAETAAEDERAANSDRKEVYSFNADAVEGFMAGLSLFGDIMNAVFAA